MTEPEFFVNRLAKRSQQFLPVHTAVTCAKRPCIDNQYGRKRYEIQAEAWLMGEA
jgi:hypothetical protein